MHLHSIASILVAFVTFVSTAPVDQSGALVRRADTCSIVGYEADDTHAGNKKGPPSTEASGSLTVTCTNGKHWESGHNLPVPQTIKAADTGLLHDIVWDQNWQTGGYIGCSASYGDGAKVAGKVGANDIEISPTSSSLSSTCRVTINVDLTKAELQAQSAINSVTNGKPITPWMAIPALLPPAV